jgi:hypothetical protein
MRACYEDDRMNDKRKYEEQTQGIYGAQGLFPVAEIEFS